jgi:hypothetical protein
VFHSEPSIICLLSVCSRLNRHPGVPLLKYGISENVNIALQRVVTPFIILAGFLKERTIPHDRSVFVDSELSAQ